jgi:uncharacterized membrane protein HdeD (DUF308 family)
MVNQKNSPAVSQSKKRQLTWKEYTLFISLALGAAAIFSFFASAVQMSIPSSNGNVITTYGPTYSFLFGGQINSEHTSYAFKGVNGLVLSSWILILIGLLGTAFTMVCMLRKKFKEETRTLIFLLSALCETVASILLFSSKASLANTLCVIIVGSYSESVANTINSHLSLQFGIWGAGLFALLSAVTIYVSIIREQMLQRLFQAVVTKVKRG